VTPREFYEREAKSIIKNRREEKDLSYRDLAERLKRFGVVISERILINRLNRGRYSFTFALQLLAALDVDVFRVPKPPAKPKK